MQNSIEDTIYSNEIDLFDALIENISHSVNRSDNNNLILLRRIQIFDLVLKYQCFSQFCDYLKNEFNDLNVLLNEDNVQNDKRLISFLMKTESFNPLKSQIENKLKLQQSINQIFLSDSFNITLFALLGGIILLSLSLLGLQISLLIGTSLLCLSLASFTIISSYNYYQHLSFKHDADILSKSNTI